MHFLAILRSIKTSLTQLNLFENKDTRSNLDHLRIAIISTRLYIVLMTITVLILVLFTVFGQKTQIVTIQNPSESVFDELYSKYSATLHCPCNQVEIPYKIFVNTSYKFHPICSSVFVSNSWINLLFRPDIGYFFPFDFRSSATGQFQLLASLCLFANRTVQDAIDDFLSNSLLSPQALTSVSIEAQSEAKSKFLKTSTTFKFRHLLNLVRGTTQMNSLQPAMQTAKMHVIHIYPDKSLDAYPFETIWPGTDDGECFCGVTSSCYASSGFFDLFSEETQGVFDPDDALALVTGFVVGCYALDALFHSSLECFFDSSCFTTVLTYFPTSNITNLDNLNVNQTQYSSNTTIEILVNNLFIEQWSSNISFSAYYSECAPILCTYKFTVYNSILQILITLLGVYGGLTVVLRICVPFAVRFWWNRKIQRQRQVDAPITLLHHLRNAWRYLKVQLAELNLFKTAAARSDPYKQRTAIISTRVYLLVMLLATSVITLYLLSSVRVHTISVEKPSRTIFENLHNKYTSTLQCPCSYTANSYESFTSLSPVFHPVCSSLYISDPWIVSISGLNVIDSVYDAIDFRTAGPSFFNTLATLCSLSTITVNDAWYVFGQTPLVTDFTIIESEFLNRTKGTIAEFQKKTISEFQHVLSLVELHTRTMYATGYENLLLYTEELSPTTTPIDFGWLPAESDTCSCGLSDQCGDVMSFFNYTDETIYSPYYLKFTLPDILVNCYVVSSVLLSSLGCFFNQTCLDIVQREVKSKRSINISILDANSTRFSPKSLIGTVLDNLMIETWNEKIEYDEYFEQCAPEQCTYTYTSSPNSLQIITTVVGLFGGLSVVLKIAVPLIVSWIRNRLRARAEPNPLACRSSVMRRINTMWSVLKTKLLQLNVFKSELSLDNVRQHRKEILTTRIYLLLLILAVIILVIYTFIDTQTNIVKVLNPSQEQFDQLRLDPQYSATLDCPCQNILVPYQSFISIVPHFHQLCASDFVATNSAWMSLLYSSTAGIQYSYDDYRLFVVPQFRLLSSLCILANETVIEAILQFSTNIMINERVQSRETIKFQADSILNQFLLSTPRTFVRTLDFIRYMAQGNGIVSSVLSNWHFLSLDTWDEWAALWAVPRSYGNENCSCGTNAMCISQASFDGFVVPGFHVGCYPLEALLQSTLECLYNTSCIDQLKSMYNQSNIIFNALNASYSSSDKTVQSLVDTLLVDRWETNVIYDQYYTTCAPLSCTYTFDGQISIIYTVTIIIGLYGGISVCLRLITPLLVQIGFYIVSYRHQRVKPVVSVITVAEQSSA